MVYPYYNKDGEPLELSYEDEDDLQLLGWLWSPEYRRIEQDHVGDTFVSTVFIPLNHNFWDDGQPVLFETMIFNYDPRSYWRRLLGRIIGDDWDEEYQWRYCTETEARDGHALVLAAVKAREDPYESLRRM